MNSERTVAVIAGLILVLLLGGCGGLLKSEKATKRVFLLQPLSGPASASTDSAPMDLSITSRVVPGLDTDRILVLGSDSSLMPVENARWADNLPEVFSSVVRRSIANSGRYVPKTDRSVKSAEDASLRFEVQSFYGIGSGGEAHSVEIALEAVIECNDSRHVVHISDRESTGATSLSRIVTSHQQALDNATRQLIEALDSHCVN